MVNHRRSFNHFLSIILSVFIFLPACSIVVSPEPLAMTAEQSSPTTSNYSPSPSVTLDPANTPTIVPTKTITNTLSPTKVYPNYPSGKVIFHERVDEQSYNYWTYVPKGISADDKPYILLEVTHPQIEDYEELTLKAKDFFNVLKSFADKEKIIIIHPVIPRSFTKNYYPQGINACSLDPNTPEFYFRPDLKVNTFIDAFKNDLKEKGYSVQDKIFVAGFSAGGMWANRYTLLHSEKVKAAAIGHSGGWMALPVVSYNGVNLRWPLGLSNFTSLTGEVYEKYDLLKEVPMFIFIGDQDTESTYYSNYPSKELITVWGNNDPQRLENQYLFLKDLDFNVQFKLYTGIAHNYTDLMISDVFAFFNNNK